MFSGERAETCVFSVTKHKHNATINLMQLTACLPPVEGVPGWRRGIPAAAVNAAAVAIAAAARAFGGKNAVAN